MKALVSECELTGLRTIFERHGQSVAILISYDEYLALRETVDIAADADMRRMIDAAEDDLRRNRMMLPEDLFGE